MISKLLPFMRCPVCSDTVLAESSEGLICNRCHALFPLKNGIVDMLPNEAEEVITPFQRLMQTPAIVSVYEGMWRRIGYYLASSRSFASELETVLRIASTRGNDGALDVACGTGVFTRPLARSKPGLVVGLDLSWPMLRHARRLVAREGLSNVLFVRATAFRMPFRDSAFAFVNCCGALHLFDRPDDALKEIRRVLSPGGRFSVQTTIRPERSGGMAYVLERFIRFGFFNEAELRKKLQRHGFEIVESERHRISFTFLARRID